MEIKQNSKKYKMKDVLLKATEQKAKILYSKDILHFECSNGHQSRRRVKHFLASEIVCYKCARHVITEGHAWLRYKNTSWCSICQLNLKKS